jgi:hypothetical protein
MQQKRKPRGYLGTGHETIGSDVLAVLNVLKFPEQVLGRERHEQLKAVRPDQWYPIAPLLEMMDLLEQKLGRSALFAMGETLFKLSHEEKAKEAFKSAKEMLYAFDAIYHNANRGTDIGGWKVLSWAAGRCEMEKNTPHHCVMEEGIVHRAMQSIGVSAQVRQVKCFRQGADLCHYVITTPNVDQRWG